jgi:hypothetical protein
LRGGQAAAVLFKALGAEQFGAYGLLDVAAAGGEQLAGVGA